MASLRAASSHHSLQPRLLDIRSRIHSTALTLPHSVVRHASGGSSNINKEKSRLAKLKNKKKQRPYFRRDDLKKATMFSLCDAMRYLRAFEVGRDSEVMKYELHVSFKTMKNSPVARGQVRMPHTVDTSQRIAVICPPDSLAAKDALASGASIVGEDDLIAQIKDGNINFERLLLHAESQDKLKRANVGRILGPKGLMPNTKTGTVVRDVASAIRNMVGGSAYREKQGVVRLAVGQMAFSPDMLAKNIKTLMDKLKEDAFRINETIQKEVHEVVLSSTNGPGFPLDGSYVSTSSLPERQLSGN